MSQPPKLPIVGSPQLSPDGRYLAFNGTDDQGMTRIWVRAMNALEAQPLPGTEGKSTSVELRVVGEHARTAAVEPRAAASIAFANA